MREVMVLFEKGDKVFFTDCDLQYKGEITVIDPNGILEDSNNVYYDIRCEDSLHKHIRQGQILPYNKERYEFKEGQPYQLAAIVDQDGRDKVDSRYFYKAMVNRITNTMKYDNEPSRENYYRARIIFTQNADGKWVNEPLRTSIVKAVKETKSGINVHTANSVYVFKEAVLKELEYQDEADLIELYLSKDADDYFAKGFYYDSDKTPHELKPSVHLGIFQDSVLVHVMKNGLLTNTVCRYYLNNFSIEFYDTLYHQQEYSTPMLIHNTGTSNIMIRFEGDPRQWTIKPGEEKRIVPFMSGGADQKE